MCRPAAGSPQMCMPSQGSLFAGFCTLGRPPYPWQEECARLRHTFAILPSKSVKWVQKADSGRGGRGGLPSKWSPPAPHRPLGAACLHPAPDPRKSGLGTRGGNPVCGRDFRYFLTVPHAFPLARDGVRSERQLAFCWNYGLRRAHNSSFWEQTGPELSLF